MGFTDEEFPFRDSFLFLFCLGFIVKKHTGGPCFAFETHREVFCVKSFEVKNDDESHNAALVIQSVLLLELNFRRESSGSLGNRRKSDFVKSVRKMSKSGTTMIFATPLGESEE